MYVQSLTLSMLAHAKLDQESLPGWVSNPSAQFQEIYVEIFGSNWRRRLMQAAVRGEVIVDE